MKKRLLSLLLIGILIFSVGKVVAFAALPATYESGNFVYQKGNNGAVIEEIKNPTQTVVIPAFLDNLPVTFVNTSGGKDDAVTRFEVEEGNLYLKAVDGVLYNRTGTQLARVPGGYQGTLSIPEGVVTVSEYGAYGCEGITAINFPDSLRQIGDFSFNKCVSLTQISLPEDLRYMGSHSFKDCTALETIELPDGVEGIDSYVFQGTAFSKNTKNWINGVLYLGNYLLDSQLSEGTVCTVLPGTKVVAHGAFRYDKNIEIILPHSVETIGSGAFENLQNPSNVKFPSRGVKTENCFGYNYSGETLGNHLFSTKDVVVKNQVLSVPQGTLSLAKESIENNTPFTTVYLPASLEAVSNFPYNAESVAFEAYAIDPNNSFYSVVDGVLYTKDMKTLVSCPPGKTEVTVPEGVERIATNAFYQNHVLTKVTLSSTVKEIGRMAFASCWGLTQVELPKGLTYVWVTSNLDAFYQCGDLQRMTYPANANPFPVHMAKNGILEVPAETGCFKNNYMLQRCIMRVTDPSFALDYAKKLGISYEIVGQSLPETPTDVSPTTLALGDVTGDNEVDAKDALEVLKASVGKVELTDRQKKTAEVDGIEGINAKDALEILKYAVKKIEKFPIELKGEPPSA